MAINLDPPAASTGQAAGRLDRHDAQARQDRWMSEMERALFSTGAKKDSATQARPRGAAARDEAPAAEADMLRAAPQAEATSVAAPTRPAVHAATPAAARVAGTRNAFQPVFVAGAFATGGPVQPGLAGATAAGIPAQAHGVDAAPAEQPAPVIARSLGLAAGLARAGAATGETAAPLDTPEPQRSAAAQPGEGADFEQRLMHLYVRDDAVHAYIRDAGLGAAQLRAVALAVAAEVASGGQKLATLTVNGKAVDARAAAFSSADSFMDDARPAPASFSPVHHSVRKGNT